MHLKTPMWLRYVLALMTVVISLAANAQVQTARHVSMIPNSGGYYEYLPQGYSPSGTQTYPLIIFVHGVGELGDGSPWSLPRLLYHGLPKVINQGQFPASFNVNGQSHKFIVLSPQFIGWPSPPDINQIIDYALANYKVDANRIYLTGLSMGGGTIWEYAGTNPIYANRVAAMVPVCGASWPDFGRARTIATANLPIWATHNSGDATVPVHYTNDYVNYINQAPYPNPLAKKTIWNIADHDAWTTTYNPNFREDNKNVYEWMLQFYRGNGTPANQAPVVNAGADQVISPSLVTSVQLSGTATDPDGSIASYSWSKISGPSQFSISSLNILNPVLTNLVSGKYTFRLTATDNLGATSSDDIGIVVSTSIPARVEAEGFSAQFGVSVESTTDAGGGQSLGYIGSGDWMEYAVSASAAGSYNLALRVASAQSGGQLQVRNAAGSVLATVTVPNTGGWQMWQTVNTTVTLPQGSQTLRLVSTASAGWNINWLDFTLATTPPPTPPPTYVNLPSKIEAENYSAQFGTVTEATTDAGGGQNLGYIGNTDWMDYQVNAASAGSYTLQLRVASNESGGQLQVRSSTGSVLATVTVPNTGGWQSWQTITAQLTLPQGNQTLRVVSTAAAGWNINWLDLQSGGTPPPPPVSNYVTLPSKIEAENYITMSGVVAEATTDAGGGQSLGYIGNGDWMEYNVNALQAGSFTLSLRVASAENGGQIQLRSSSGSVLATFSVPNTGGWQVWQTITASVTLPQGNQTLRLISTASAGWNINWINFAQSIAAPPASTKIEAESYATMSGVQVEGTSDAGGGQNVGYIDPSDWMQYSYNAPQAGNYTINFRVATPQSGGQLKLYGANNTLLATLSLPNTGGWQMWQTVNTTVTLAQGTQSLFVVCSAQNWNFNWMEITASSSAARTASLGSSTELLQQEAELEIFPNPVEDRFALKVTNPYQGEMKVLISDMQGKTVKSFSLQKAAEGTTQHYLSIGSLPQGQYILQVSIKEWSKSEQIIKL